MKYHSSNIIHKSIARNNISGKVHLLPLGPHFNEALGTDWLKQVG